jgi:hypothetical protein
MNIQRKYFLSQLFGTTDSGNDREIPCRGVNGNVGRRDEGRNSYTDCEKERETLHRPLLNRAYEVVRTVFVTEPETMEAVEIIFDSDPTSDAEYVTVPPMTVMETGERDVNDALFPIFTSASDTPVWAICSACTDWATETASMLLDSSAELNPNVYNPRII